MHTLLANGDEGVGQLAGSNLSLVVVAAALALVALGGAAALVKSILAAGTGTDKMREIAGAVQEGASAYLRRQFRALGVFVVIAVVLLFLLPVGEAGNDVRIGRSLFFIVGAGFSAFIGWAGMSLATRANVRVASAARDGEPIGAMHLAFRTGGVVGFLTIGLGLLGAAIVVFVYHGDAPVVLEGFGFGAALLAMFMRVGGGIFTKAADVGADLVGKVEQGIPEDDPRNPATIADNVGDNVGDCAGMAADLFESYAVVLVASLILGRAAFGETGLVLPLLVASVGIVCAIIGVIITRMRASDASGLTAINRAFYISAVIGALLTAVAVVAYVPSTWEALGSGIDAAEIPVNPQVLAIVAVVIGIALAAAIMSLTGYYTDTRYKPTRAVSASTRTGAATNILSGFSLGLESAVYTALLIAAAVLGAYLLGGGVILVSLFAVALAGCGLLTTVGVIVAMDTFGPISDNAQGIAEMSGDVEGDAAQTLTDLDAVGNTTKAITKGIAIATAVLAATALFGSYTDAVRTEGLIGEALLTALSIADPANIVGLIIGASVVFLFSGLAINAVARSAGAVVNEVRDQFARFPGIMEGTQRPEYGRVVDICTRDAQRELMTPGLLAITAPIAVGFGLGVGPLAAYLAGAIACGVLMAILLANSGGAWDNAKKDVEDGNHGGKGSEAHAAAVIGDTVGDPFKDTAGPAINPLLKVMNLVSLIIAPAVVVYTVEDVGAGADGPVRWIIAGLAVAILVAAILISKRRSSVVEAGEPQSPEPRESVEVG
ncbi:sodium-translocating pyrophosphatase [Glycomyces sp. TRM65418]|uniref:sodium-translocating pyrophosphatase n=1 Tax=Glycomyces sp. TRM65418 TaxID=2867006 RepID=UPI001CE5E6E7|nr:sodium-translocating pyrophosphatase [Glycomyces sp. TRM65418]MCC3762772.1 sodium-translocating pyrophosphatase [Glycomyces sp. TRM65418]QZD56802.1 sodium-translocating pyrophosphatase [Glycomyces sp. TRM65418]